MNLAPQTRGRRCASPLASSPRHTPAAILIFSRLCIEDLQPISNQNYHFTQFYTTRIYDNVVKEMEKVGQNERRGVVE